MSELRVIETFRADLLASRPRRRLRPRWLLGGTFAILVVTGTVTAATGTFPIGNPLTATGDGPGKPVPHSAHVQAIRAPDPDGGPDWGLRVYRIERHSAAGPANEPRLLRSGDGECEQLGRIVDGKLGVIAADGRFHALPLAQAGMCLIALDPRRPTKVSATPSYTGWSVHNVTASGAPATGYPNLPCNCGGKPRWVFIGMVTPDVVAVELGGRRYPVVDRRFLIVLRSPSHADLRYVRR